MKLWGFFHVFIVITLYAFRGLVCLVTTYVHFTAQVRDIYFCVDNYLDFV